MVYVTIMSIMLVLSTIFSIGSYSSSTKEAFAISIDPKFPDLKIINSGKPPSTENFNFTQMEYKIEPILWNLTLPSSVAFDDKSKTMFIAESGFAYGGFMPTPKILKLNEQNGTVSVVVDRMLVGPITSIVFHDGKLYVANRDKISTVDLKTGLVKDIITGLPSNGDHHTNQIVFNPKDGRIYFGQGTATNSGIVGVDNYHIGWLKLAPTFHDISGKNITLTGQSFETPNVLSPNPNDTATTGGFVAFGNSTQKGQMIEGNMNKCNGCIISAKPDGTDLELVAWGLRNPFGLTLDKDTGKLLVSMNGADERGSRPIASDTDKIYTIDISNPNNIGKFYGWPDFYGNAEPVTDPKFKSPRGNESLQFLMQEHPEVVKPIGLVDVGYGLTQIAYSANNTNNTFGQPGKAFIGAVGTMAPLTHVPEGKMALEVQGKKTIGQEVLIFDPATNKTVDFLTLKKYDPTFRPVGLEFSKNGSALYVASIGKYEIRNTVPMNGAPLPMPMPWPYDNTGVIWKITKSSSTSSTTTTNATAAQQ